MLSLADVGTRELEQAVLLEFFWCLFLSRDLAAGVDLYLTIGEVGCFGTASGLKDSIRFK